MIKKSQFNCPACGKGRRVAREEDRVFQYKLPEGMRSIKVPKVPVEVCSHCGEKFYGPASAKKENLFLAKHLGILTPDELKRIRKVFTATTAEFSRLTGIEEKMIMEWESGKAIPTRAMDQYLRLLVLLPHRGKSGLKRLRKNPIPV